MIIKGSSRGNPKQLTTHLLRTDTNERVALLELQNPSDDLGETLSDWQVLSGLTRGRKGLYHANIDPDARYTMTREQWLRAVDVLAEELGLQGQPRAVVMHEKHGRQHIHVVWQRTDLDREVLIADSHNYKAHERASARLEEEFGHERVPGKHAKRDREKPILREAFNHAEWQQAERTGEDPRERKAKITDLYHQADNAEAFRAGLLDAGYMLAKGDRRDFVLVDAHGEIYSLARCIEGAKAKQIRDRLADLDLAAVPSADEAKAFQKQKAQERDREAAERAEAIAAVIQPPEPTTAPAPSGARQTAEIPASSPQGSLAPAFSEAAAPPLTAVQENALRRAEQRLAALADALAARQAAEWEEQSARQRDTLADALGTTSDELTGQILAIEGSRFAPDLARAQEAALSPQERAARLATLNALRERHHAEQAELRARHEREAAALAEQRQEELERLHERFERERQRAQEAELLKEEARERERTRDDDLGHTRS